MSYGEFESEGHRDRCALIGLLVSRALGMPGAAPIEIEEKVVAQRKALRSLIELDDRFNDEFYSERHTYAGAYYTYYKGEDATWQAARDAVNVVIES